MMPEERATWRAANVREYPEEGVRVEMKFNRWSVSRFEESGDVCITAPNGDFLLIDMDELENLVTILSEYVPA